MSKFIDARVIQKTGSEAEWLANDLILYKGELALVTQGDRVINIKVGNGTKKFSELPYIYNGGFTDSVTPTTQGSTLVDGMYIANGAGIYTNMGGLVVKDGYFTIISKVGNTYKIASEVKMPTPDLTPFENRITEVENNVDDFIENFSVEVDQEFDENSDNSIANSAVSKITSILDMKKSINLNEDELGVEVVLTSFSTTNISGISGFENNNTYTYSNIDLIQGKFIRKIKLKVERPGTLTIFASKNVNTVNSSHRQIKLITLESGKTDYLIDYQLNSGETLSFGAISDTGGFGYILGGVNIEGGSVLQRKVGANTWSVGTFNLNISIIALDSISGTYYSQRLDDLESAIGNKKLLNKKVSFIGDSITTFSGYIPNGYSVHYPANNVNSVEKTWWSILLSKSGGVLLDNNSSGGSRVTNTGSLSLQTRLNAISTNTDVCFMMMGINDFGGNLTLGNLDFTTEFTLTEFTDAYCNAVKNLITNYPTVKFYFMTPLNRELNNTFPTSNGIYTLSTLQDRIIDICKIYGVQYIDMRLCGINKYNYSNYLYDGVHPNSLGMQLIADYVYSFI